MKRRLLYTLAILFATLQTFAQTYTYDSNNRLTNVVYDDGTIVVYTFDALGNRLSKKVASSTTETYTISTTVTPSGSGTVTGAGNYYSGLSVELNAIANAGYKFSKWSDGVTTNPRTITVTGDQTYTAQFVESATRTLLYSHEQDGISYSLYCQVDNNNVRNDNDGTAYLRTTLTLDVTKDGKTNSYTVDDGLYVSDVTSRQKPCVAINTKTRQMFIFDNSSDGYAYALDGYCYVTSLDNISFQKETVFRESNWGWWPKFTLSEGGQLTLTHFSFDGYHAMASIRNNDGSWTTNRVGDLSTDDYKTQNEGKSNVLVFGDGDIPVFDELVVNGNFEGSDFSSFIYKNADGTKSVTANEIVNDNGNNCLKIVSQANVSNTWESQFFVKLPEGVTLSPGTEVQFSMRVKASRSTTMTTQGHDKPEEYLCWGILGTIPVSTEWKTVGGSYIIPNNDPENAVTSGKVNTVVFDLNCDLEHSIEFYFDDISITVPNNDKPTIANLCPDNHHPHMIDLGLPSGTKWACCNVGADKPEVFGGYYAWGETAEKEKYSWETYLYGDSSDYGAYDIGVDIAGTTYDVAYVKQGSNWRMPTLDQMKEITYSCTSEWITLNDVKGLKITGSNGNSIFLPAAGVKYSNASTKDGVEGHYWTSNCQPDLIGNARLLNFAADYYGIGSYSRRDGVTVRAVVSSSSSSDNEDVITFADTKVKAICVENWDTNGDGELSKDEAAAVTDLGEVFGEKGSITSFNELQYFTGLKSIGDYAFLDCRRLTSITIPSSVTNIGQGAFLDCSRLTSITIPSSVTSIGQGAFLDCSRLTSITIPSSVTSIGDAVFSDCDDLVSIVVESGNTVYDSRENCNAIVRTGINALIAGCKNTVISNSVTSIGNYAFDGCSGLTSITIPNSVASIGNYAFDSCDGLTSIIIPSSVTSIGKAVFMACSGLSSIVVESGNTVYDSRENCNAIIRTVTNELIAGCKNTAIPTSVTSIGDDAFRGCTGLTSITIPNSVTSIGESAFRGCTGLTSITIPNSVTSIGESAFSVCSGLTSVTIPNSVTSIGNYAFYGCDGLTSVIIPNSVTSIEWHAFEGCHSLTSVTIPNSVTSIGNYAFYGCSGLTSVTIPNSVTSIGNYAFCNCTGLIEVHSLIEEPFVVNVFQKLPEDATLYVPVGTKAKYEATDGWKSFKNIVETGDNDTGHTVGDTFTANTVEGVAMTFKITSVANKQCQVGIGEENSRAVNQSTSGTLTIPSVVNGYSVTSIGACAFHNCYGLTSVTIPNSVTSIGDDAFIYCGVLKSITIPNSVTSIGETAFWNCDSLKSITIPNSVTSIGERAFGVCRGLTSIVVESGNTVYDSRGNCNAIIKTETNELIKGCKNSVIPNSVTSIGYQAFNDCIGLTSVTIPNSVTSIGEGAFNGCDGLTSIIIPSSVTSIGEAAFSGCSSLTSIVVESGNTVYDSRENCNAIIYAGTNALIAGCKNTVIPSSVTYIGAWAFYGCSDLTSVTIPNSVTSIGKLAFAYCYGLTSVTIPNSVTSIRDRAFEGCSGLTEIHSLIEEPFAINNDVFKYWNSGIQQTVFSSATLYVPVGTKAKYEATEGWNQFKNIVEMTSYEVKDDGTAIVKNLESDKDGKLVIPEKVEIDGVEYSVTEIAPETFKDNQNLVEVTIPGTVTTIGAGAFAGCGNLKAIYILSSTPASMADAAARGVIRRADGTTVSQFDGVDFETCVLYVPYGCAEAYRNAEGWKLFKHIVEFEYTDINEMHNSECIMHNEWYDLRGRRIGQPKKGVNILRDSNGRMKKVVVK